MIRFILPLFFMSFSLLADGFVGKVLGPDGEQLMQEVERLKGELSIREKCSKGDVEACSQLGISGRYQAISVEEIPDEGVDVQDLGNMGDLITDVSEIIDRIDSVTAEDMKIVSDFLNTDKNNNCHVQERASDKPFRYHFFLKSKLTLSPTQISIMNEHRRVNYFIIRHFIDTIIVKVVRQGDKLTITYYKKEVPHVPKQNGDSILAQELSSGNFQFKYDAPKGSVALKIVDDGGSYLHIGSTLDNVDIGGKLAFDSDNRLGIMNSYQFDSKNINTKVYFERGNQKIIGLEYSPSMDIEGEEKKEETFKISSELYKGKGKSHALIKAEYRCKNNLSDKCKTWVSFAFYF